MRLAPRSGLARGRWPGRVVRSGAVVVGTFLAACSGSPSEAEVFRSAFVAAQVGDEAGLVACAALGSPADRGFCELTAVAAARGRGLPVDCTRISAGKWRDECFFDAADIASNVGDPADAVRQCREAGEFRIDCVRHVSVQAFRREGGFGEGVDAAIREVAPELDVQGSWRTQTQHQVYVDAARHAAAFTAAACGAAEDVPDCLAATAEIVQIRWERMARQSPSARRSLCPPLDPVTGVRPLPTIDAQVRALRLVWDPIPVFEAAVRGAQGRVCEQPIPAVKGAP